MPQLECQLSLDKEERILLLLRRGSYCSYTTVKIYQIRKIYTFGLQFTYMTLYIPPNSFALLMMDDNEGTSVEVADCGVELGCVELVVVTLIVVVVVSAGV